MQIIVAAYLLIGLVVAIAMFSLSAASAGGFVHSESWPSLIMTFASAWTMWPLVVFSVITDNQN